MWIFSKAVILLSSERFFKSIIFTFPGNEAILCMQHSILFK